jgi:Spy/CpxP family protein refolding chaperone
MKRGIIIACLIGLVAAVGARAADESTNKPPAEHRPMRPMPPMMDSLLPPRLLDELALTADQKTKYDALNAAFKKDAAKWRTDNNYDLDKAHEEMRKARDAGDNATMKKLADQRKGLMDIRKSYIDKLRAFLTDEQTTKLEKALEHGPGRGPRGGPSSGAKPPGATTPPPPPPSDK